jgi:CRP/FNR family transcriptional regulator, cyclic AMP receptor protein
LARTLLLFSGHGEKELPQKVLPNISQETLAEMVGTTSSQVNIFMNKFRKLGYIEYEGGLYEGGLHVNASLLNVVHHG